MEMQWKIKGKRCHPLGNKELHHQQNALDKKLREEAPMEKNNEREEA